MISARSASYSRPLNPNPNVTTRFAPGNTLGRRPKGARARLGEKFLQVLANDFDQHGDFVMQTVRTEDPSTYFTTVAKLLPREVEAKLQVTQAPPGNLDPEEWTTLRRILDIVSAAAPGAPAAHVFDVIEGALRGEFARTIDHAPWLSSTRSHPHWSSTPSPSRSPLRHRRIERLIRRFEAVTNQSTTVD